MKEDKSFEPSNINKIGNITLSCISPDASELLDKIMEEWKPSRIKNQVITVLLTG